MTRLFYRCPIAAAWMCKNFGVQLECDYAPDEDEADKSYPFDHAALGDAEMWGDVIEHPEGRKIYVTTESLPIFEPQEGDLLQGAFGCVMEVLQQDGYYAFVASPGLLREGRRWNIQMFNIDGTPRNPVIKRQGKAFIMPEVEA